MNSDIISKILNQTVPKEKNQQQADNVKEQSTAKQLDGDSHQAVNNYPQIENAIYSQRTIKILQDLAYGKSGEITAIFDYSFQDIIAEPFEENVSKALELIAEQEMVHLELLGKAIRDFGGLPNYTNQNNIFWSARNGNYNTNIKQFLEQNVKLEQMAISDYTDAAQKVTNQSLSALLSRIAEDEMEHLKIFKKLLANLD